MQRGIVKKINKIEWNSKIYSFNLKEDKEEKTKFFLTEIY